MTKSPEWRQSVDGVVYIRADLVSVASVHTIDNNGNIRKRVMGPDQLTQLGEQHAKSNRKKQ